MSPQQGMDAHVSIANIFPGIIQANGWAVF